MIPISTSRAYLFGVKYKGNIDALIENIKLALNNHFNELSFKDITFVASYSDDKTQYEIHINKFFYKNNTVFGLNVTDEIRLRIESCLRFVGDLSYDQLHFVNDNFGRNS